VRFQAGQALASSATSGRWDERAELRGAVQRVCIGIGTKRSRSVDVSKSSKGRKKDNRKNAVISGVVCPGGGDSDLAAKLKWRDCQIGLWLESRGGKMQKAGGGPSRSRETGGTTIGRAHSRVPQDPHPRICIRTDTGSSPTIEQTFNRSQNTRTTELICLQTIKSLHFLQTYLQLSFQFSAGYRIFKCIP
jgi:hypothetical protein